MTDNLPPWVLELLKLDSFTAAEAGEVRQASGLPLGNHGPDVITGLRKRKGVKVEVVGMRRSQLGAPLKLYRLRLDENLGG